MFLRKSTAGAAPHGHVWHVAGDVVEVPDWLGEDLLAIPGGGFIEVEAPEPEPEPVVEPELTRGQKAAATRAANKAAAAPETADVPPAEAPAPEGTASVPEAPVEAPQTQE